MTRALPKRVIIIAGFLLISSLITIMSLLFSNADTTEVLQLPNYLAWYNHQAQTVMGIMSNSLFIVLSILMLMGKNLARIVFNYINTLSYIFSVLLAVTSTYKLPAEALGQDGPDMNELMNSVGVKGAIATMTTIFFVIIMWGINCEKSRKFFRGSDEALHLTPGEDEVAAAQAEREKEASEFES